MENTKQKEIINALNWRYAVRVFDPSKKVSDEDITTILNSGRLAPSSIGLEPWKFIVVENQDLRLKMKDASFGQVKVTDASHIIVIARRTDYDKLSPELVSRAMKIQNKTKEDLEGLKNMADGAIFKKEGNGIESWITAQTYIPLGMMIQTAALLNVDTGPMEGFDPQKIDEILGLKSKNLTVSTILAVGYRGDDKYATLPKIRRDFDEVVEIIK
jgi:nitroreductase